jgi:hypothetical protein
MLTVISGTKIRHIFKLKLRNLKLTRKNKKILGTCIGASMTSRKVTILEKGYLVANSHSIVARWTNYFS